jgi:hypothetical protein
MRPSITWDLIFMDSGGLSDELHEVMRSFHYILPRSYGPTVALDTSRDNIQGIFVGYSSNTICVQIYGTRVFDQEAAKSNRVNKLFKVRCFRTSKYSALLRLAVKLE